MKQIVKQELCLRTPKDAHKVASMAQKSLSDVAGKTDFHAVNRGANPLGDARTKSSGQENILAAFLFGLWPIPTLFTAGYGS